jgi:hypothetical protein
MKVYHFPEGPAPGVYGMMVTDLLDAPVVHTGEWQSMNTTGSKLHATHEMEDVSLVWDRMPADLDDILPAIDHDWADDHYLERVSGIPHNPAPSHLKWPYAVRGNGDHTNEGKFDHTYPERFWPTHPNDCHGPYADGPGGTVQAVDKHGHGDMTPVCEGMRGIRFRYGDLSDVVDLLVRSPLTRQAYLPVWFPEDTGAHHGQRVPCTLGYHFMQRGGRLTCRYYIRSCDVYRHLSNDVYLAGMLTKWICDQVSKATTYTEAPIHFRPGGLVMHISSLHAFVADEGRIKNRLAEVLK